jgi:hypothetical protein
MPPKVRLPHLERIMGENSLHMNSIIIAIKIELKGNWKTLILYDRMESQKE